MTFDRRSGRAMTLAKLLPARSDVPSGLGFGERIIARCPLCGVEGELRYEWSERQGKKIWRVLGCCAHYDSVEYVSTGKCVGHIAVAWDFSQEVGK